MKANSRISAQLGISQQDMAALLGVHRSQWSMYESGKRSLPITAMQLLAPILKAANASSMAKTSQRTKHHAKQQQHQLECMLRENEFQRLMVARKIAAAENKQQMLVKRMQVAQFLNKSAAKGTFSNGLCKAISDKASLAINADDVCGYLKLEHKRELLEVEKSMLETRLQSLK